MATNKRAAQIVDILEDYSLEDIIDKGLKKLDIDSQAKIEGHFGDQHEKNTSIVESELDIFALVEILYLQVEILSEAAGKEFVVDDELLKRLNYAKRRGQFCTKVKTMQKILRYRLSNAKSKQEAKEIISSFDKKLPSPPRW